MQYSSDPPVWLWDVNPKDEAVLDEIEVLILGVNIPFEAWSDWFEMNWKGGKWRY